MIHYINGMKATPERVRQFLIPRAFNNGIAQEDLEALLANATKDAIDGAEARDLLLDFGVEIILED